MKYFLSLITVFHFSLVWSQSVYVPFNKDYYNLLDRYEILSGSFSPDFHTTIKSYQRKDIANFVERIIDDSTLKLSDRDKFNLTYIANDNWEFADSGRANRKPLLWGAIYKKQNAMLNHASKDFDIQANPVLYLSGGKEVVNSKVNPDAMVLNTRGVEIRGMIGKKLGFYTMISDNQAMFPTYVRDRIYKNLAVPEEGFYKDFPETGETTWYKYFFKSKGVDYFTARGYITFDLIKNIINVQFGNDKHYIGNGYRSLFLSDFSSPYLFAKINTKVWIFNYTLLYAQLKYGTSPNGNNLWPTKFYTMHHLSLNLGKNVNIGLFEGIMYARGNELELSYFNPIIFYKAVENQLGSKDKAVVGLDAKVNFLRHFSFYGSLLINEFVAREVFNNKGWWGNKQAYQLGLKYINVAGVKNLDLQLEANIVRPYVYFDKDSTTGYTNYNTALAHPSGANFTEFLGIVRYQPLNRLNVTAKCFYITQGLDKNGLNYGSDPLKSYQTRVDSYGNTSDYGVLQNQGALTRTLFISLTGSYMLRHNFFIELNTIIRNQRSTESDYNQNTVFASLGFRWNIQPRLQEF